MPSEPLCDVCYYLTGGRDMMHSLRGHEGDVCTRCHAHYHDKKWNRATALVQMHDALTTAEQARVLCDRCGRAPTRPVPTLGDVCERCGAVYVQDRQRSIDDIDLGQGRIVTFLIPGWRPKTAIETMKEAIDGVQNLLPKL
jgi:NMD protein affecting ribosome stability and mRNA decay